jgi:voltage-gated sodium channel
MDSDMPAREATARALNGPPVPTPTAFRRRLGQWVETVPVQVTVTVLIVINAVTLGLETSPAVTAAVGDWLKLVERIVLAVFVLEIGLKLTAHGWRYFRSGWNVFDFLVVGISLVPASGPLAILRSLRVLRVLRLLSSVRRLRQLVEGLLRAVPSIGWVALLLLLVFYVFAVMGTALFGAAFPDWFGTLGASMYTLFQIMTLESWSMGIARPVMAAYPFAWLYFVAFIMVSAFTVLNLFIGIVVNAMQAAHWEEEDARRLDEENRAREERREILQTLRRLDGRMASLEERAEPGTGPKRRFS